MQWIDGHAYGQGKLTSPYIADGGFGVLACLLMAGMFGWSRRRGTARAEIAST